MKIFIQSQESLERIIPANESAVRTHFTTGFPRGTVEHFESLLEFIDRVRLERLGVFKYSREEGSCAPKTDGQIPASVKNKRHARAMATAPEK